MLDGMREQPSTSGLVSYFDQVSQSQYISEIMAEFEQTLDLGLDINSTIEDFMKMPKISEFSDEILKEWSKN
jgi:hypothetical protein